MSNPISIHNVPAQMSLPARTPNEKGKGRRRAGQHESDANSDSNSPEPDETEKAENPTTPPEAGSIGTQIDIEA